MGRSTFTAGGAGAGAGTRSFTVRAAAAADPDRPLWFPGSTPPEWLDGRSYVFLKNLSFVKLKLYIYMLEKKTQ